VIASGAWFARAAYTTSITPFGSRYCDVSRALMQTMLPLHQSRTEGSIALLNKAFTHCLNSATPAIHPFRTATVLLSNDVPDRVLRKISTFGMKL